MARQKSEDRIVPKGRRKAVPTRGGEPHEGGKAIPVDKQARQLGLFFETAEVGEAQASQVDGGAAAGLPAALPRATPKSRNKERTVALATMEEVTSRLREAFEKVASNKGAAGPDGESVAEVRKHLDVLLPKLSRGLLAGTCRPGEIRRVWIPKADGGQRGLGIPNVVDRVVQEAERLEHRSYRSWLTTRSESRTSTSRNFSTR